MPARIPHKFIDGVEHKRCGTCKEYYDLTFFGKNKLKWDKLHSFCQTCLRIHRRKYYKKHREKVKKDNAAYVKNNRDKVNVQKRNWSKKNPEKVRAHRSKCKLKRERNGKAKAYRDKMYQTNVTYRLSCLLRCRLTRALTARGVKKTTSTMKLCGCSLEKLKQHLESQFTDGMSWDNKGEWHIDHVKPCAAFDLTDVEQQKECFHFTNLQPLWALDNLKKGAKY